MEFGNLSERLNKLEAENAKLRDTVEMLLSYTELQQWMMNNRKYEITDMILHDKCDFFFPQFRSDEETIRLITEEGKSLGRFGDGEFGIMYGIQRQSFQRVDPRLRQMLLEVMENNHPDYLIGIAKNYGSIEEFDDEAANGIRTYMNDETRLQHSRILRADYIYSNAYITRPYIQYRDKKTQGPVRRFAALKKIWTGKRITTVEGAYTRLGAGNDLFAGAVSVKRILAPPFHSFDRYDDLLRESLMQAKETDLFILAIGPSSGVLAYDLVKEGIQAVDIGHLDLEYDTFLLGENRPGERPYKYNDFIHNGDNVQDIPDESYYAQIVASYAK